MKTNTTRAATHAWWVSSLPELDDLCPLQLILGQGRLAVGAPEPTRQQKAILAEPWNKRYARLLDVQTAHGQEMASAAEMTKNEAASVGLTELTEQMRGIIADARNREQTLASIAVTDLDDLLEALAQAAPPAALVQAHDTVADRIINWLRRNANAERASTDARGAFIEAHNAAVAIRREAASQPGEMGAGVQEREWRIKVAGPAGYVRFVSFAGATLEDALENVRAQNYCAAPDEDGYISIEVKV